ncbi:MAG: triphosphoribosyl-dephospho-CoA synthase [Candidatus Altiarchaeota archaeon]
MNDSVLKEKIKSVAEAAERSCVLEASSEKPGNVSPTQSFSDTKFEDYLAGSNALKPAVAAACLAGCTAGSGKTSPDKIRLGALIKKAMLDVGKSHDGGNTHLGVALVFIPISAGAGLCMAEKKGFACLRECIRRVVAASTVEDALNFYEAVNLAEAGGLPKSELDVKAEESKNKIREKKLTFTDIMKLSSEKDMLARELSTEMPVTFDESIPLLSSLTERLGSASDAIVQTYLVVLSRHPDTLIAKKAGMGEAERVSARALEVIGAGGVLTEEGRSQIRILDRELRVEENKLNPGTTADLIAASIFVSMLKDVLG